MEYEFIRSYRTTRSRYRKLHPSTADLGSDTELILTTDPDGKKKTLDRFQSPPPKPCAVPVPHRATAQSQNPPPSQSPADPPAPAPSRYVAACKITNYRREMAILHRFWEVSGKTLCGSVLLET